MSLIECVQFYTPSTPDLDYQDAESTDGVPFFECFAENEETLPGFNVGDRVTLYNLKVVELNGRSGKITKYVANERRWEVKVDGYSCAIKVTADHLKYEVPIRPGDRVVFHGLKAKDINGKKGTAKKFISGLGRWEVEMDGSDCTVMIVPHKLKHENRVKIGDRVTLQGLNMEEMNGKSGRVTHFNEIEGRWEVQIDGDEIPVQVTSQKLHKGEENESEGEQGNKLFKLGDTVSIQGLKIKSMNGKSGKIITFVADEGRWEVAIDGDWSVKVRPENLIFVHGMEDDENDHPKKPGHSKDKPTGRKESKREKKQFRLFKRSNKANE